MEPQTPVLFRRKTLTNSAAEFVETRAREEVLLQLGDSPEEIRSLQDSSEFMSEIDKFVPKGVIFDPKEKYNQSQKSLEKFRRTLQRFVAILKERNVDTQLNITIKDPSQFTCDYVLHIIDKIRETRESAAKTRSCKNFVRRCYRKMEDNRGAIEGFLTMIPNDIYGSVISGGFVMIMAAVEKHAEHREAIQNFLAEIPEKLETIQRLSQIHHDFVELHSYADAVIVAVFTVLERIVDEITKTRKIKMQQKAKNLATSIGFRKTQKSKTDYFEEPSAGGVDDEDDEEHKLSVADALARLQIDIDRFQRKVDICNQEKLGSMQIAVGHLGRGLRLVLEQNRNTQALLANSKRNLDKMLADIAKDNQQPFFHLVQDALYRLLASNPNFSTKTGEVNYEEVRLLQQEKIPSHRENNTRIASGWLKRLRGFPFDPMTDMKECLKNIELLDCDEKNMSHSILHSDQFDYWLQGEQSSIIDIDLHIPPASLDNPLSFTSALFATALRTTAQFPVLAFFCAHRNNDSPLEDKSGPIALIKSLDGQLLKFISDHRPSVDLTELEEYEFFPKAKKDIKAGLRLLDALLSLLSEDDMVFIIIDSLSRLSGSGEERMIKRLVRMIRQRDDLVIKVMVTDALPGSYIKSKADVSLHTPDLVMGPGVVDISGSSDEIAKKVNQNRHMEDADGDVTVDDDANDDSEKDDEDL
ncbi:hypothetical protein CEP53_013973 [Fusarium sp. AF-6]|nr:hypothetical protein CEP53_013973 [Fusarium sp. AF-6]